MQLSAASIEKLQSGKAEWPDQSLLQLPEKVLQFGTGVLLRGLPDYFIDKANKQGLFNGRVVVVKSTDKGGTDAFDTQNGLYTLLERGYVLGEKKEKIIVNAAISRVLSAAHQWESVLQCAENPAMQIVISNTTEVGITLLTADASAAVPVSFPGKLLAFLLRRYHHFKGADDAGMVIIPTELITDNGAKLKAIVTELARLGGAEDAFIDWLHRANDFCNSLVDRIVPGKPSKADQEQVENELGYKDELMIMSETYRLWAIETDRERSKQLLSFAAVDAGVVLAKNINRFRELKLRLLNGTHTFTCALACLSGFRLVKDAMQDPAFLNLIQLLMLEEIVPVVAKGDISKEDAKAFAEQVLDRFRNPYIDHQWEHIAVQYTSKMAMRNVPLIQALYASEEQRDSIMALGFAAYLHFMKPIQQEQHHTFSNAKGMMLNDDKMELLYKHWKQQLATEDIIQQILADQTIWGADLSSYSNFMTAVAAYYFQLEKNYALSLTVMSKNQKSVA
ncbi:tagaturonate reductase [Sediminibacterium goheungense]|uniref:Tagaturonate reductase n=1 Tax=Sediminibacterium goheungense TaxID=1086393 RepID=A0A4R6J3C6_9BACT|nr:tagaturonate reductase [Sediminibacterium goheungense]TDO28786.1 tagaturonate reductase [Sediminibacterium goheungense]